MEDALLFAQQNQESHLEELLAFLTIPSVSTQPKHRSDVKKAATWLAAKMDEAGLENIQVIDLGGHPLVYSDWLHAGKKAPTVLIYGHYDVQPAEPFEQAFYAHHPTRMQRTKSVADFIKGPNSWTVEQR